MIMLPQPGETQLLASKWQLASQESVPPANPSISQDWPFRFPASHSSLRLASMMLLPQPGATQLP